MSKVSKTSVLKMLSANLKVFFSELQEHFLCPTCLTKIPLKDKERISEAHIIPKEWSSESTKNSNTLLLFSGNQTLKNDPLGL